MAGFGSSVGMSAASHLHPRDAIDASALGLAVALTLLWLSVCYPL